MKDNAEVKLINPNTFFAKSYFGGLKSNIDFNAETGYSTNEVCKF